MKTKGFTLIELMVAIAIVAILSAIAFPSYAAYVRRGKLSEGTSALAAYQLRMEQAYQDNGNYGVGGCATGSATNLKYFTVTCALSNGGQGYVATATGQADLANIAYTINEQGERQTNGWTGRASAACWLVSGSEC